MSDKIAESRRRFEAVTVWREMVEESMWMVEWKDRVWSVCVCGCVWGLARAWMCISRQTS